MIAGVDFSSRFVDIVKLDETTDAATWHRFPLEGADAFDRARSVGLAVPGRAMSFWDDVLAVGIEEPQAHKRTSKAVMYGLYRVQGAVLACVPPGRLVQPFVPAEWRKAVGLKGNASKEAVWYHAHGYRKRGSMNWPQDACDAYCIALATRSLLQHGERAA